MKIVYKFLAVLCVFVFTLNFTGMITALAATTPSLGMAATYGVLGSTYTNTSAGTMINGDVGFTTGPAVVPGGSHVNYGSGVPYASAGADQGAALASLASQLCTYTFPAGAVNLSTDTTHGPIGVYTPGVYCSAGAMDIGGPLNLNGNGTYIFRSGGALTSTAGATVSLTGASACDVFWTPIGATTLAANTTFFGTVIDDAGITAGANTTWTGRALAFGGTITTDTNTITAPVCAGSLATLHVIKQVINNNGSTSTPSSFNLHVTLSGTDVLGSPAAGTSTPGATYLLPAGTYVISEDANSFYVRSFSGDCTASGTISLLAGDNKTCTITNDDIAPIIISTSTIKIIKNVINNNGRTKTIADFPLFVNGAPVTSGATNVFFAPAAYTVTEISDPNYTRTFSGDCNASGNIALLAGDNKTCTITNDDIAPIISTSTISVVKIVINDSGFTKTIADFPLFVNGVSVISGVTNNYGAGAYTITETADADYARTFSGDCDPGGHLSLAPGESKICIITNNDIAPSFGSGGSYILAAPLPPLIAVVKVPSPLALPEGPGLVSYTYTLSNIGTVPVTDITMVGDTCAPVVLNSGDINNDARLQVNETWIYKCSTYLSQTHTNTVVATGWANGLSVADIANATVVVGLPVVPPLIHVTKIPNPLSLPAKGGIVTYTEKISNPGTVALSNVHLNDDRCAPMKYVSGDINGDSKLGTDETWVYTCSSNLTKTTTNTVVASGEANGLTVRDFAVATVVVAGQALSIKMPKLPDTGLPPAENSISWNIVAAVGIFTSSLLFYAIRKYIVLRMRYI